MMRKLFLVYNMVLNNNRERLPIFDIHFLSIRSPKDWVLCPMDPLRGGEKLVSLLRPRKHFY